MTDPTTEAAAANTRLKVENADLLNAVTDLIDEKVFGDAASRYKAERIISLILTAKLTSPDREAIRRMIGDLRWQGSALAYSAAELLERFSGERNAEIQRSDALAREIDALRNDLEEMDRAAEDRLAERGAELAKAYDVIAHTLTRTDCFSVDIEVVDAAHASHAARQKQNDGER